MRYVWVVKHYYYIPETRSDVPQFSDIVSIHERRSAAEVAAHTKQGLLINEQLDMYDEGGADIVDLEIPEPSSGEEATVYNTHVEGDEVYVSKFELL